MSRFFFFVILLGILLLIDFYTYQGVRALISDWSAAAQKVVKGLFWSVTILTILTVLLFQPVSQIPGARMVLSFAMVIGLANILGKVILLLCIVTDDVTRAVRWAMAKLSPPAPEAVEDGISRSEFLAGAGLIGATVPFLSMGWGILSGAHDYQVYRRTLKIKNLPKAFEGFTITQISDIHTGSFWNKTAVKKGVELINEQKSDVVFFTGDIVNNKAEELVEWAPVFAKIRAEKGVYSVLGNHDYGDYVEWPTQQDKQKNLKLLMGLQDEMGWNLLINENRLLKESGDQLAIVGVENWGGRGRFPKYGKLDEALKGTGDAQVKLLLSHDPSHWKGQVVPEYKDVDVMFSGHTHGMQFGIEVGNIKWSPVKYFYPEWADLYEDGDQKLYVNRGFGYIGYPGRFGILPEITVFTLTAA